MKTLNQFNFETGELYRAVVESSTDAIITKSLDGTIRSWNKSAERIFGYTAEEAIGQSVLLLIPEDHHNEESDIIRRIKAGERVDHFETIRRRKDGTRIPISLTISPIKNSAGNIVGASKVARDITSQKEYESQLIAQADELEQFAYVASHDLREPLRKVAVYTELLTEKTKTATTPETTKYADFILESVTRMQRLISGLLDYSRANRSEIKPETVDLNVTMKNVLSDLEFSIKESSAKIKVGPLPTLFINPFQIHQILQNLISNAIKFRPRDKKDGPIIDVSATEHADHVVLSVKDNGIGIDPQYQDKVFRIFQRLHSRQVYPGTGIGLASCKKVIEHLGGKIWFESKPHHGTTFFVSLPIPNKQRKST